MSINLEPGTVDEEIAQNVGMIVRTRRGSQPLDRELGIDANYLDDAGPRGCALLAAAIIDTLPSQEPRIAVKSVTFPVVQQTQDAQVSYEAEPLIEYEVKL